MVDRPVVHVVDDDDAVRDSLTVLLGAAGHAVADYPTALVFLEADAMAGPGCILLDVRMPEMDGIHLLEQLKERGSALPVVMMTGFAEVPLAVRAMKAGAVDFIEKPFDDMVLLAAIERAIALSETVRRQDTQASEIERRMRTLTEREHQVFVWLVKGAPNKVIAHELGISPRTVEIHRARVMEKMQAASLSHLVRMALAIGVGAD